ncbi:hypothetical protein ABID19_005758 [Mesorhizobium robiniae]|uniref:Uncharacterized protein n=1 Tax=Mesorhizobium robiniae TaxID=559315 RepID=A0ABV2GWL9_9HYPH
MHNDGDEVIGAAAQLLANVVDQKIDAPALADDPRKYLATNRLAGRENGGLDARHPFPPACLRRQVIQLPVKQLVS